MHEDNQGEDSWPPAPVPTTGDARRDEESAQDRPYLTAGKGSDVCLATIAGLTLQWLAFYGASAGLLRLIDGFLHSTRPPNLWHLVAASVLAPLPLLVTHKCLRGQYPVFAGSLLWAGLSLGVLLLWLSFVMATDTGPNILPR